MNKDVLLINSVIFQFGAFIVYFFDYTIGCGWWLMVLYVMQLCAIFVVRGKPYSGEQVVSVLITKANFCASWLSPLLAFSWHVVSIFDCELLISNASRLFNRDYVNREGLDLSKEVL